MEALYPNYVITEKGDVINKRTGLCLKKRLNKGYEIVDIFDDNGDKKTVQVHRLVAMQFIPNPDNLPQVNHKNFIRNDNRIENLEWCNAKYNMQYSRKYGRNIYTKERNEKIRQSKLGKPRAEETKRKLSEYWSGGRIAGKNNPMYGKKLTKESIQKRTHSRYHKNKCVDGCSYCLGLV